MRNEQTFTHCLVKLNYWVTVNDHLPYCDRYCSISIALPNYHSEENREMIQQNRRDWVTSPQEQRSVQTIRDKQHRKRLAQWISLQVETIMRAKPINYSIRMSILHLHVFQANQTHFHKIIFARGRIFNERQSRHSEISGKGTILPLNWSNSENTYLPIQRNAEEIILNHKETRMVKDGDDWRGLQNEEFDKFS